MTMKRYYITLLFILTGAATLHSQSASFLNTFSDARLAAMGNAGYAMPVIYATHYNNAALLYAEAKTAAAVSYVNWQPQAANSALINAAAYTMGKRIGIAAGFRYHTFADMQQTDMQGNLTGSFAPREYAIDVGLAYKAMERLAVAATVRYIGSDMGGPEKGSAFAIDLSVLYQQGNLNLGLGYSNLGTKIGYGYSEYGLPARIKAGASYRISLADMHHFTGSIDAAYQTLSGYAGISGGLGVEYVYKHWGALRAGYHLEDEKNVGASYASVGCGAMYYGFKLDFACILAGSDAPIRQSMVVSLGYVLK
jgi:hypothetical protein